ncbi:hypothetical protein [Raoultibacter phocaeensis]|uniref:hypothetical protein n=1 Tax=Raoultibacter phocaeensis TaxID=2479841 RepID=UPI00111807CF|nr:hypothetical protein [Raoultibacter phocaeensis]
MSGSQKALKVVSILLIVYAVIMIAAGAFLCFGASIPGVAGQAIDVGGTALDAASLSMVFGVSSIIGGVLYLIIGLLGMRGAKDPRKIGPFFVLSIIGVVLGVVSAVMGIVQGTFPLSQFIGLLVVIVCAVLAYNIKKQRA